MRPYAGGVIGNSTKGLHYEKNNYNKKPFCSRLPPCNPAGEQTDCIDKTTKQLNDNQIVEDTANNLRLIEELILGNTECLQLSQHTIAGLDYSLSQAQKIIER